MTNLTHYDPFFIGFENILSKFNDKTVNFPPYNIYKITETSYGIDIAIAGYNKNEISVSIGNNILEISGIKKSEDDKNYIHKGITTKSFSRTFSVAETIEVLAAVFEDGLLKITLENKIPETKKVKTIVVK